MHRRSFLVRSGAALGAVASSPLTSPTYARTSSPNPRFDDLSDWSSVRAQFDLEPGWIHLAGFLLSTHPAPVREAIARHRRGFDRNPVRYLHDHQQQAEGDVRTAAGDYFDVDPGHIALTDSTTMGLGLLYGAIHLEPGQEILSTTHDHYATEMSLRHRCARTGTALKQVSVYDRGDDADVTRIVESIAGAITPRTRIVAVTWVHSSTGVKLPIRAIADAITTVNADRGDDDRIIFCVDGVHGLGIEDETLPTLGCDFFVAGTHKWLFGPRGTGVIVGRDHAWPLARPIIPTFNRLEYGKWMGLAPAHLTTPPGPMMTPGGFHSFEHRWALNEAFDFHQRIGKRRIAERIHALNTQLKEGLAAMDHVTLYTPMSTELSAGIVCFMVRGMSPQDVVDRLDGQRIIASVTPYATQYARLSPSLLNDADEIDRTLRAVAALA